MLDKEKSFVMLVDVQEKFRGHMVQEQAFLLRCQHVIKSANALGVPVMVSEQYPKGLGETVAELKNLLPIGQEYHEKHHFSAWKEGEIQKELQPMIAKRPQMVVCGLEAHVCVLQTALDCLEYGAEVFVVADAVSSRTEENRMLAFERMRQRGVEIINVEMLITEWCQAAKTDEFSAIKGLMREAK